METDGVYYFNRCRRCNRLITKLAVLRAFKRGCDLCPCGSMMFGPTNPVGLEWLKPAVFKMIAYQLLGRLAPPPEDGLVPPIPPAVKYRSVPALSPAEMPPPEDGE